MRPSVITCLLAYAWVVAPLAQAQPKRVERNRQELLDKLGLDKVSTPKLAPQPAEKDINPQPVAAVRPAAEPSPAVPPPPSFRRQIHPWLTTRCQVCHQAGGPAAGTGFLLGTGLAPDYASTKKFLNMRLPAQSALVMKTKGEGHAGGALAAAGSSELRRLTAWIAAGASLQDAGVETVASTATRMPPSTRKASTQTPVTRAAADELPVRADSVAKADAPPTVSSEASQPAAPQVAATPHFEEVHSLLQARCSTCHTANAMASRTAFLLKGDAVTDYPGVRMLVTPGNAEASALTMKATGQAHLAVVDKISTDYQRLTAWINAGAQGPSPAPVAGKIEGKPTVVVPPPPIAHHASAHPIHAGIALPLGLQINGRFDMNLERRGLKDHPLSAGRTQFQNYHRFLFLSRDEPDDPVKFTVELTALTFWEAAVRVSPKKARWQLLLKAGKLIVPFGVEPLFHQSYGGLQGFDQRVLPVLWAQNGFAVRFNGRVGNVGLLGDLYAMRGYGLDAATDVLNLQTGFSSTDDVRPAYGGRVNLSWRSVSIYHSLLVNNLGFGRTLLMQALDLNVWRWHGVPVLERLTFGAGLLRADVTGAGAGLDYYHFASYAQTRFYIADTLYLQYRQGLRAFNNRRGLYQDNTRLTSDDGSAHNVGIVWRHQGLSFGAFQFWNFEKKTELRDDFFRMVVAYEF